MWWRVADARPLGSGPQRQSRGNDEQILNLCRGLYVSIVPSTAFTCFERSLFEAQERRCLTSRELAVALAPVRLKETVGCRQSRTTSASPLDGSISSPRAASKSYVR